MGGGGGGGGGVGVECECKVMRWWCQEKENLQLLVVDTCDLFIAHVVDAITSDHMVVKCV